MPNKIELLKKIQALAERGVGGERQNAEELLAKLMAEYGIQDADLSAEEIRLCTFRYSEEIERRLLTQVIYMITGDSPSGIYGAETNRRRKKLDIDCTEAQRLEIEITYDFYRRALKTELDVFFKAFCRRNNMYPGEDKVAPVEFDELTPEEQIIESRAAAMSRTMDRHTMQKMLSQPFGEGSGKQGGNSGASA